MTIVTKNSLTLSNVNDGTITHIAYANSADGTDGFTTVYPNLNLSNNTQLNYDVLPTGISNGGGTDKSEKIAITDLFGFSWGRKYTPSTRTAQTGMRVVTDVSKLKIGDTITNSFWIKNTGDRPIKFIPQMGFRYGTDTEPNEGVSTGWNYVGGSDVEVKNDGKWTKLTFTTIIPQPTVASNRTGDVLKSVVHYAYSSGAMMPLAVTDTFIISPLKLEQGSTATPWMPSSSEVTTADWPSYIGTYSDSNVEASLDYSKYQWAIFKGQNSNAYTAYSWSSDGTDRFSTVYPNLNLLNGSSAKTKDGFFKNFDKVENDYGEVTVKGTNTWVSTNLWDGFSIKPRDYKPNDKYTMSMDVMFTSWNLPAGTTLTEFWIGQRYSKSTDGSINSWKHICDIDLPRDPSQILNQWIRITKTSTIPPYEDPAVNTEALFMTKFTGASEGSFTVRVRKPKQEVGLVTTPYMPSESEAQDQWQDAIPMYVGVGEKDSQNPSDYRWQLNPRYVQASSDSGLSNKAGIDDLASVADTANDALVKAQNAVSNEDYTSWLEHDYQSTIDDLQDISIQNQEDIRNVDDRTTAVEGFYDEMKIKWNFIDESFTFSEEGMFISNSQSKMAIQVTSDKIVFWDNDVDVAFITGEVLNIQRGVFLESATIGNHLITKFSDDSPVTIITYVGGTN